MTSRFVVGVSLLLSTASVSAGSALVGNVQHGQQLYESRCGACHSLDDNRVGPAHHGVYGRHAGRAKDYEYSKAVANSTVVWTETTLNQWLTNPEKLIPGQKMGYSVPDPQDRADLIAYLRKASAEPASH
jgi:cytochrome c